MSLVITLINNLTNDVRSKLEYDPEFIEFCKTTVLGDHWWRDDTALETKIIYACAYQAKSSLVDWSRLIKKIKAIAKDHELSFKTVQYTNFQQNVVNANIDGVREVNGIVCDIHSDIVTVHTKYGKYYVGYDSDCNLHEYIIHTEKIKIFSREVKK